MTEVLRLAGVDIVILIAIRFSELLECCMKTPRWSDGSTFLRPLVASLRARLKLESVLR